MKRMRFFSAISLMILCICILGAGVYAANTTDRNMGMAGTITIPSNLIGVEIEGYLGEVVLDGDTVKDTKGDPVTPKFEASYTDAEPKSWQFDDEDEVKHLTFNTDEANTIDDVKDTVTISFVLTNSSDFDLSIYFGKKEEGSEKVTPIWVDSLNGVAPENTSIVNVYLGSGTLGKGTDTNKTRTLVTMKFGLNKLLDESDTFNFNYTLVVEEAELIETPYNELINKVKKLEELSTAYNTENGLSTDTQLRAMQYIRESNYGDAAWDELAGAVETEFVNYIANGENSNLADLQSINGVAIPSVVTNIDFVHMIAIVNVYANPDLQTTLTSKYFGLATLQHAYDLVGWGGDLCQLAINVKEAVNGSTDTELIKSKARELFMSSSSGLSAADLFADMDAVNIAKIYSEQTTKSLSAAMESYYYSLTYASRKSNFIANSNFGQEITAQSIVSRLSSNTTINYWCMTNGLSFTTDAAIFNAVATVFADYLAN